MCMFTNDLPSKSVASESSRKPSTMLFLKPNRDKEFYRFRLLNFRAPEKSTRDFPFIERWVHQHWGKTEKGINVVDDTVTCLTTAFVQYNGNKFNDCPVCRKANEHYGILKASGFKDKVAREKNRQLKRVYQAIIPIYVVNDPNNEKNNGKIRCFMFAEKGGTKRNANGGEQKHEQIGLTYTDFLKIVNDENVLAKASVGTQNEYEIFNGGRAKDFYVRVDDVEQVNHPGEPNEYRFKKRCITKMGFLKTAYEIPDISKDAINDFPFDETYYVSSTPEELEMFYKKYFRSPSPDVPDEDIDIFDGDSDKEDVQVSVGNAASKTSVPADVPVDDLLNDPDDLPADDGGTVKEAAVEADIPDESLPDNAKDADGCVNMNDIDNLLAEING